MTCPDPIALARTNSPDADPEVVEHLKSCPSCLLDWQIRQGARYALDPEAEVPPGLNERAIARIERKARELEEATRWWDLPILGVLVAIAAFAFFLAGGNAGTVMSPGSAAIGATVSGIVAALYTWHRDRKEYGEVLSTAS
jgi:predicted anti-sigma-YlaC factor YlaD